MEGRVAVAGTGVRAKTEEWKEGSFGYKMAT